MPPVSRMFLALGAAMLFLATTLGAYGSHALAGQLSAAAWSAYGTAVDYHFYHGLGLLAIAVLSERNPKNRSFRIAGWAIVTGIVLFCGGIYATTFGAPHSIGLATPLGGVAFLVGWLALGLGAWTARQGRATDPLA